MAGEPIMMSRPPRTQPVNIAFTSTGYGPMWSPAVASWLRAVAVGSRECTVTQIGKVGAAGITDRTYTHTAENGLVQDFLADPSLTHLFMTEMDMILPPDVLPKLLALDVPIASGIYFLRNGNGQPCLFQKVLTSRENPWVFSPVSAFPLTMPFRVDHPGLGCVLFERAVFESVKYPWFDLSVDMYGSDMYFYTKVKDAGIPVWAHPDVMCDQIDYKVETFDDYKKRLRDDPAYVKGGVVLGTTERHRTGVNTVCD
jgi:hypothetical protein